MRIYVLCFTWLLSFPCVAYEKDISFGEWSVYCAGGNVYTKQKYNKSNFINVAIYSDDSAAMTITRNYRVKNKDFYSISIDGRLTKLYGVRVSNYDRKNANDQRFDVNGVMFEELTVFPDSENEYIHRASFATKAGVKRMRELLSKENAKFVYFDEIQLSSYGFKKAWDYMLFCKPL